MSIEKAFDEVTKARRRKVLEELVLKCFRLGQGGWNEAGDEAEYLAKAMAEAETLGLL